jgi:hypothetical protein
MAGVKAASVIRINGQWVEALSASGVMKLGTP